MSSDDTPEARLARWLERDREIGAQAQLDELRARLAERDGQIADLRARIDRLANDLAQERSRNVVAVDVPAPLTRRIRSLAGRVLRP